MQCSSRRSRSTRAAGRRGSDAHDVARGGLAVEAEEVRQTEHDEAADRAAQLLVRGARESDDEAVAERLLHLADTEGIEAVAEVWAGSPADSLAGCLWRLYLLRAWVHAEPVRAAGEFEEGRTRAPVARAVAGVAEPPGPEELKAIT